MEKNITCDVCKIESVYSKETLMKMTLDKDIKCDNCGQIMISFSPETKSYSYGSHNNQNDRWWEQED